ncbi:MAG: HAD family hydrolase [Omnitrophica WOR_2 bacterium]
MFDLIAFDADDTLWHNETLYQAAQEKFRNLLSSYAPPDAIDRALYATELANLSYFGYGIKSFILSMIETSFELSGGRIQSSEVVQIVRFAKEMIDGDVQLFEHVAAAVSQLAGSHTLMLITKGDPLDQERKFERSGLASSFKFIEILSDKTSSRYADILARHQVSPDRFLMVGNSLRSDIFPVLEIGGCAVYIPYHLTWAHEKDTGDDQRDGFYEIEHIGLLPELVDKLEHQPESQ